jgi:hypothetical protein
VRCYDQNQGTLDRVWRRLDARLDALPGCLGELGRSWRAAIRAGERDYWSLPDAAPLMHLPIWAGAGADGLEDVLEATALSYWYVRIQDNLIDEPESRGQAALSLLGNVLLWDAAALWARVPGPWFPGAAREAWLRFSERTEAERRVCAAPVAYPEADFVAHAEKVALAEVPVHAVRALRGLPFDPRVRRLVHLLGLAYGRVNDVMGMGRDIRAGANTFLLATARARTGAGTEAGVVATPLLEEFLDAAAGHHREAVAPAIGLGIAGFDAYTDERLARLAEIRHGVTILRLKTVFSNPPS